MTDTHTIAAMTLAEVIQMIMELTAQKESLGEAIWHVEAVLRVLANRM